MQLPGLIYAFDPIVPDDLLRVRAEAAALGRMLGYDLKVAEGTAGPAYVWLVSDPAVDSFAEAVPV